MQKSHFLKWLVLLFVSCLDVQAQDPEIDRLINSEFKMTFPSVYFKHKSTGYAQMPYTTDSCFQYIAKHIKEINSFVMWQDSSETESLTDKRIKKIKADLNKYTPADKISIEAVENQQKISPEIIRQGNKKQRDYLLSLNSVFDVSGAVIRKSPVHKGGKRSHVEHPRIWCKNCWRKGRFSKEYRQHLKQLKSKKQSAEK